MSESEQTRTLLLVEDQAMVALAEKRTLTSAGYGVRHVQTGADAVDAIQRDGGEEIDLVLMDIDLGDDMDGVEAARRILAIRELPIVFLSSHAEPEYVTRSEQVGSYGYVLKQAGDTVLLTSVKGAFRLFEAHQALKRKNEELARSQEALRRRERDLAVTLDSIGDAVIATDAAGCVTRMNPVAEGLTGWRRKEAEGVPLTDVFRILDAPNREPAENPVTRVLETGTIMGLGNDTILVARDGSEYQIADSAAPIVGDDGAAHGVVLVFRDVTEEYRLRRAVEEHEAFLTSIFESVQDGISVLDPDLTIRYVNGVMERWYPSKTPLPGRTCYEAYQDREAPCPVCPTLRALETGKVERGEVPGAADSPVGWIELFAYPMKEAGTGRITGIVEFVRDITDRRRMEAALRESEEKYRSLFEQSVDEVYVHDLDGNILDVNRAAVAGSGYAAEELLRMTVFDLHPPGEQPPAEILEQWRSWRPGEPVTLETRHRRRDGTVYPVEVRTGRVRFGEQDMVLALVRDITERKRAEERIHGLLHEKEVLLREVHHRIKNNLNTVRSLLSLQADAVESAEATAALQDAGRRMESMRVLYERLHGSGELEAMSLRDYVPPLVEEVTRLLPGAGRVRVTTEVEDIELSAKQLSPLGLLVNELVTNAVKHGFPDGRSGTVTVGARAAEDGTAVVEVADDGVGLPAEIEPQHSPGLGLTLVSLLAEQIGATLSIEREGGTRFVFELAESASRG